MCRNKKISIYRSLLRHFYVSLSAFAHMASSPRGLAAEDTEKKTGTYCGRSFQVLFEVRRQPYP